MVLKQQVLIITRRTQTLCFDKGEFVVLEFNLYSLLCLKIDKYLGGA